MTDPTAWSDDEDLDDLEISIDPSDPLAHLYADAGDVVDVKLPLRTTSLEELEEATPAPDEISDGDVDELAVLVKAKIDAGTMTDEESAELGLGVMVTVIVCGLCDEDEGAEIHEGPADTENLHLFDPFEETYFDLNATGLRVVKRIAEKEGLLG